MFKRKKFFIGGIIIFIAIGYLAYTGFQSSATYYFTVSELLAQGSDTYGQSVRVNGDVGEIKLEKESGDRHIRFVLTEGGESLPVIYRGVVPDAFQTNIDVVVEGHLNDTGDFEADSILVKCPSKYVPENE